MWEFWIQDATKLNPIQEEMEFEITGAFTATNELFFRE